MAISKQIGVHCSTKRKVINKEKTSRTGGSLPRSGHYLEVRLSDCTILRENPRAPPQTLQTSHNVLNVKVHDRTI